MVNILCRKSAIALIVSALGSSPCPAMSLVTNNNVRTSELAFAIPINGPINSLLKSTNNRESHAFELKTRKDAIQSEVGKDIDEPIIVEDNNKEENVEYKWQEVVDSQGKTKFITGAKFPVRVASTLNSKTAKVGDPVEAWLKSDIKIADKVIASKGAKVIGHVTSVEPARRVLHAELSAKRWMRANGALGIQFDEMINAAGDHLPLVAAPAQQARIVKNQGEGRVLGVNDLGQVASPLSIQLKNQALHLAIRGAASAGGVFSMGAVPVAYGVIGAINPSFAFLHPVGKNVPHRRLKGFALGVVSGLPGGFLVADSIIRGQEAIIKPGDEFQVEFKQDFNGEAANEADLLPNASVKVRGEVLPAKKN